MTDKIEHGIQELDDCVQLCVDLCEDRKAEDLVVYSLRGVSVFADFIIICSGHSLPHIRAIAGHLERSLREKGVTPRHIEGTPESRWILLDYFDIVIHVFHPELRDYYCLEALMEPGRRIYPPADLSEAESLSPDSGLKS